MFLIERFFKKAPQTEANNWTSDDWRELEQGFDEDFQYIQNLLQDPKFLEEIENQQRQTAAALDKKGHIRIGAGV